MLNVDKVLKTQNRLSGVRNNKLYSSPLVKDRGSCYLRDNVVIYESALAF